MTLVVAANGSNLVRILSTAIGGSNVLSLMPSLCLISVSVPNDVENPCTWTRDRIPELHDLPGNVILIKSGDVVGTGELLNKYRGWSPDTMALLPDDPSWNIVGR